MELVNLQSKYQHIALEGTPERYRLWLDGYFQFDSKVEKHYHQMVGNLPMGLAAQNKNVLILGGGDGLVAREVLKYPTDAIVNIELDPAMVELAKMKPLVELN